MSGKIIRMRLEDLAPLSDEDHARLDRIAALPDSEIDLSDIPELTDEQYANAVRYDWKTKRPVTIRLDPEIVEWFKGHAQDGRGYQTEINRVLRQYVTDAAA